MLPLIIALIVLAALEGAVWRYGADSRDGNDWAVPGPRRGSPIVR